MKNWINGEKGPTCFCGRPTVVLVKGERTSLLCFEHEGSKHDGAVFPLPQDKRPDMWPHISNQQMESLVDQGFKEQNMIEGDAQDVDISKLLN